MQADQDAIGVQIRPPTYGSRGYMAYVLLLLFFVYGLYAMDRSLLLVLVEPIKHELKLSDSQIGFIAGPAFSIFFAMAGVPFGLLWRLP